MGKDSQSWQRDLSLRSAGLLSILLGLAAARHLLHSAGGFHYDTNALDFLLAVIVFLSLSAGTGLVCLGAHIYDQVEISKRWARRGLADARTLGVGSTTRADPSDNAVDPVESR